MTFLCLIIIDICSKCRILIGDCLVDSRQVLYPKFKGKDMSDKAKIVCYLVIIALALLLECGCGLLANEDTARHALEINGFSNIEIVDRAWFAVGFRGGDRSDAARFTATATNPAGKKVTVYVFVGWPFKGGTIRTP
jgi:hypothetical protein